MLYQALAEFVVIAHMAFVAFATLGGFLVIKWKTIVWIHIPAVLWAAFIEFYGWVCPLTPLENWLRLRAGEMGYQSDFIARYLLSVLYPSGLTREFQFVLAIFVIVVNVAIYGCVLKRARRYKSA